MTVPFVDLHRTHRALKAELDRAFRATIEDGQFILGESVEKFEKEFARYLGVKHCVGVASGSDALTFALRAAGIGPGKRVATVSHTFVATVDAILHVGAIPVLVDVEKATGNMDPDSLKSAATGGLDAVLPVDLYGQPASLEEIEEIAEDANAFLLEDACQAHGAKRGKRMAGSFGNAAAFSFYPGKNLGALGDGGALVTNDDQLAAKARLLHNYGQRKKYDHVMLGFNSRLDTLQAEILRIKLKRLDDWNDQRRATARSYDRKLAGSSLVLPVQARGSRHVYHIYAARSERRDALRDELEAAGVGTSIHYPKAVHQFPPYQSLPRESDLDASLAWASEEISLPMFPGMTAREIDHVVDAIDSVGTLK